MEHGIHTKVLWTVRVFFVAQPTTHAANFCSAVWAFLSGHPTVVYFRRCDPFSTFGFGTVPTFLRGLSPFSCFLLVVVTLFLVKHGQNSLKGNLGQAAFWREEGFGLHGSRDESGEAWLAIAMGAAQKCNIGS